MKYFPVQKKYLFLCKGFHFGRCLNLQNDQLAHGI